MSTTRDDAFGTDNAQNTKDVTPRQPRSLWLNRDFMLLWSGQVVSNVGTQVSTLAFPLLILALTGSPAQAGFAGALRALPYLIFSLPAGALIDRWDRKLTMILCDTGRALSLASIPVALAIGHQVVQPVQMPVDGLQSPLVGLVGRGQLRIPVEGLAGFEVGRLFRHQQHVVRIGIRIAAGLLERDRHLVGEGLGVVIAADISAGIEASEDRHADHQKDGKAGSSSELTGPNA